MIVDNADDVGVYFLKETGKDMYAPLALYLPKAVNGRILVMLCNLDAAEKLTGSDKVIIRVLVMEE